MNNGLATLILMIISLNIGIACTCAKGSYTFMDKIDKYPFVAMVEVIGKDTIRGKPIENINSFLHSLDYAFTTVRVLNQYSGKYIGNEIKIIDSKGFECFTRLSFKNIGEKFIVKGGIADVNDYVYTDFDKSLPKEDILVLSLCDTNQLLVEGNEVKGWITLNRSNRWWKFTSFLKRISFGLIDRKRKPGKKFKLQEMAVEEFVKLIKERT